MAEYEYNLCQDWSGSFNTQASRICKTVKLSLQELMNFQIVMTDMRSTLCALWPGCEIEVFGSAVTGLAFKNSDLDFFVRLPAGKYYISECFTKIKEHVARYDPFEYVRSVTLATVPVITLKHSATDTNCDVTFTGPMAVHTNKLLKYLLSLDHRALQLAVLIKYWTKQYHLTTSRRLSSYAVTLLLIFYLQRKNILPSVASLQRNASDTLTEGWNVGFEHSTHESSDTQSVYSLLGEFFMYYNTFNFEKYVVCPYLGYPISKCRFMIHSIPHQFTHYARRVREGSDALDVDSPWCVQDPFEHNRNSAVFVDSRLATRVDECFAAAVVCYKVSSSDDFLRNLMCPSMSHNVVMSYRVATSHSVALQRDQMLQFPISLPIRYEVPEEGLSWKTYFILAFCTFILFIILNAPPQPK